MPSEQVRRSLATVELAAERKGFDSLLVAHYDNSPASCVVLRDDHGHLALGEAEQVEQIIGESDDLDGLWSALERAEMTKRDPARQS